MGGLYSGHDGQLGHHPLRGRGGAVVLVPGGQRPQEDRPPGLISHRSWDNSQVGYEKTN